MFGIKQKGLQQFHKRASSDWPAVDAYSKKAIFDLLWPNGFQVYESYIPPDGNDEDPDVRKHMPPHHKHSHFVKCMMHDAPQCNHAIYETKKTQYGNAVKHVSKCVGDEELAAKLHDLAKEMENKKPPKIKRQTSLFETLNNATAQDTHYARKYDTNAVSYFADMFTTLTENWELNK